MNKNHIFIDTNILVGAYNGKETDRQCLQYLFSLTGKKLFVSALSVSQFVSVMQKKHDNRQIREWLKYFLLKFNIVSFQKDDILKSLLYENTDMEDNIQYVLGQKTKCFYFVTNNTKDYKFINIEALKPANVRLIKR
ncbi:MAG: type II toxin-antitoxin system VapC family toxin [Bacteroidales bacterium]|nr:type II toxin-antitoxin system VapC family toxin [Bacteroidales bacterium]